MTRNQDALESAAYDVADEYRDGKLRDSPHGWDSTWNTLRAELERRCPGFSADEYDKALNDGFTASR